MDHDFVTRLPSLHPDLCRSRFTEAEAKPFVWPALADGAATPSAGAWRWVSYWDSRRCRDDYCTTGVRTRIQRMVSWKGRLASDHLNIDLSLLLIDHDGAGVAALAGGPPEQPAALRMDDEVPPESWLATTRLTGQVSGDRFDVFLDPHGHVRCVSYDNLDSEEAYAAIKEMLSER